MIPRAGFSLGHSDKVVAKEHTRHPAGGKDPRCERRAGRGLSTGKVCGAGLQHGLAGQKLQRRGVGCGFGLDEHGAPLFQCKICAPHRPLSRFGMILKNG